MEREDYGFMVLEGAGMLQNPDAHPELLEQFGKTRPGSRRFVILNDNWAKSQPSIIINKLRHSLKLVHNCPAIKAGLFYG